MSVFDAPAGAGPRTGGAGATGGTALVPVFVRLKLSLLRNGLRQSSGRRAAYIASVVITLLIAAGQLIALIALRGNAHVESLVVLLAGVLALGWAVMPLFFSDGDETLDPSRLVMLPLRPRPLITALLTSSLVGIGPLFTLCLTAGSVIALAHGAGAAVFAVLAAPLTLLVCVALARTVATANSRLLTSRKGRDLAVLSGLVIAVGIQAVNFGAQRLGQAAWPLRAGPGGGGGALAAARVGHRLRALRVPGLVRPGRRSAAALRGGAGPAGVAVAAQPGQADDGAGRLDARRGRAEPGEVRFARRRRSGRCSRRGAPAR